MISGPSSYPPTVREFLEHWGAVNAHLGAGNALVLKGNIAVATLDGWKDDLDELRDEVTDAGVDRTLARQQLNGWIVKLQGKLVEFNERVRADLAGTAYERSLPKAFAIGDAEDSVRQSLRAMSRLWMTINAIVPTPAGVVLPMILRKDYQIGHFDADRDQLRLAYQALSAGDMDLKVRRELRNDLQDVIYAVLKAYRLKIPTALPDGHALMDSLPALTPPEGHTPDPVVLSGAWNAGSTQADLSWTESTDADLASYQVRGVPGEDYVGDDEVILATIPAGSPRTFSTAFALEAPGAVASFKVFVVLDTGRERGSEPVTVERPV